ncbi:MAG: hypothetical protein QOF63_1851 [Thermoanaerobaculia bacterium]|nr:hypothetical protein [Thermoanaerobaculia bacterium]
MAKIVICIVAAVRTVAPGFKPGVPKCRSSESALKRAKERIARNPSLSPAQAGSQNQDRRVYPRLKAVGYGSYEGFADGEHNRSAAGSAAGPPAARWRVANSNLPPIRRRTSRRAAGATAGA